MEAAMGKMTLVFEFEDGKEPSVNAGMQFNGGRLCSVSWDDYKEDLLIESEVEAVKGLIAEHEHDWWAWCDEFDVEPEEIERKLNLMG